MDSILITGASSGVGKELVFYLSQRFKVIAVSRRKDKMIENFKNLKNIKIYELDISNDITFDKVLNEISTNHNNIKYIINNAGVLISSDIEDLSIENDLEYSIKVNALAPFKIIRHFLPNMKEKNFGRIINLTSGAPLNCFASFASYSSSKAVLNTLTVTLSKELLNYNIKVNLMSPGPVKSEMSPNSTMSPSVCFPTVDYLLNLSEDSYSGEFFWLGYKVPLFPDLKGVNWLEGIGNEKLEKVIAR